MWREIPDAIADMFLVAFEVAGNGNVRDGRPCSGEDGGGSIESVEQMRYDLVIFEGGTRFGNDG